MDQIETKAFIQQSPLFTTGPQRPVEIAGRQVLSAAVVENAWRGYSDDRPLHWFQATPTDVEAEYKRTFRDDSVSPPEWPYRRLGVRLNHNELVIIMDEAIKRPHISLVAHLSRAASRLDSFQDDLQIESALLEGSTARRYFDELTDVINDFEIIRSL